jgi:hypothetical protein
MTGCASTKNIVDYKIGPRPKIPIMLTTANDLDKIGSMDINVRRKIQTDIYNLQHCIDEWYQWSDNLIFITNTEESEKE